MKTACVLICFIFLFPPLYSQQFHSLDGVEDAQGNTNLIYKLSLNSYDSLYNPIYRLDLQSNIETIMIDAYFYYEPGIWHEPQWKIADDYEFFMNDPIQFVNISRILYGIGYYNIILSVNDIEMAYIDDPNYGEKIPLIEISKANPLNIYCSTLELVYRSFDGGYTYPEDSIINFPLLSVADFDDQIFFGTDNNRLIKSEDQGTTFSIVDTSDIQTSMPGLGFYYDVNQFHIYRLNRSNGKFTLNVSNNKGNAFTWT